MGRSVSAGGGDGVSCVHRALMLTLRLSIRIANRNLGTFAGIVLTAFS
jgi:hypothetical protein